MKKALLTLLLLSGISYCAFGQGTPALSVSQTSSATQVSSVAQKLGLNIVLSEVKPGAGVTEMRPLSVILPELAGTGFDTPIFFLGDTNEPAAGVQNSGTPVNAGAVGKVGPAPLTVAIVAGAHENEIAGILAAYYIVERCHVTGGRLIVVPRVNASGGSWSLYDTSAPRMLNIGGRVVRYGTRLANPAQEIAADPERFVPPLASGSFPPLAGEEARNINREYPGNPSGNRTAQAAYAITQLLVRENASIAFDLHEASSSSSLFWSIITRREHLDEAALAALDIEDITGVSFHLEDSRDEFAGYSHWEWGKLGMSSFLVETYNPAQPKDDPSVDQLHNAAAPLAKRIFVHLCSIQSLMEYAAETKGVEPPTIQGLPSSVEDVSRWLGATP